MNIEREETIKLECDLGLESLETKFKQENVNCKNYDFFFIKLTDSENLCLLVRYIMVLEATRSNLRDCKFQTSSGGRGMPPDPSNLGVLMHAICVVSCLLA